MSKSDQCWSVLIRVLVTTLITVAPIAPAAAQGSASTVYVVQAGDTLSGIARHFNVSVAELAQMNSLLNPDLIYVGQSIRLPASDRPAATPATTLKPASLAYRVHVVQPGENLFRIALQYQVGVGSIAAANNLGNTALIFIGQQLAIPGSAAAAPPVSGPAAPLPDPFITFDVGPLPVSQGNVVIVKVRTREPVLLEGLFIDWAIPFAQDGDTYYGIVGVSANPVNGPQPGIYPLTVTAADAKGIQVSVTASVQVSAGRYNYETIVLPPDRQALLDPNLVAAERAKLDAVWTRFSPLRRWSGAFSIPVKNYAKISSPFGTRRSYGGSVFSSYHEGTDFSASTGTPVYAPAGGVVVLAEPLTVRGNAIVIDHGWGVYTGLYHLSEIDVTVGQTVQQGDFVGRVGGTGLATGPHLHWDVRIRSLNVDPLQFTRQALP